jgi:hypothetical protein
LIKDFIKKYIRKENTFYSKKNKLHSYFQPILFKKQKLNIFAFKKKELLPFADMHQENRYENNVKYGGVDFFMKKEIFLKKKIENFIKKDFGEQIDIKDSFSRSVISYRFIKKNFKKVPLLEIGPGSGYLGILLKNDNYHYSSFEITRPHFLFQNYIFYRIFNKQSPISILNKTNLNKIKKKEFHIPWWEISNINEYLKIIKPKIIIFNHCINEMHEEALDYFCKAIVSLKNNPVIFIEGFGSQKLNSTNKTLIRLAYHNIKIFYHKPIKKYNISKSLSIPITLLSSKNIKNNITFFNYSGFLSKYGFKKILKFLIKFSQIKFNFYYWKIYFLDFLIIDKTK